MMNKETIHYSFFSVLHYPKNGVKKLSFFNALDIHQAEENPTNMYFANQLPNYQDFILKRVDYVYEQYGVPNIIYNADKNRIFNSTVVVVLEIGCKRYFHGCGLRDDSLKLSSDYPILLSSNQNFSFSMTFNKLVSISSDAKIGVVFTGILTRPVC